MSSTEIATETRRMRFRFDRTFEVAEQLDVKDYVRDMFDGIVGVGVASNFDITVLELEMWHDDCEDLDVLLLGAKLGARYGTEVEIVRDQVV